MLNEGGVTLSPVANNIPASVKHATLLPGLTGMLGCVYLGTLTSVKSQNSLVIDSCLNDDERVVERCC